jgi:thiol-disulfide isomerase/thioredoxin
MMSDTLRIVSYLALAYFFGSVAHAGDLESYLTGEIAKLQLLEKPVSLADLQITYPDGNKHALKEKNGKVLLVNLWAKWCAPCKDEMKDFSNLQRDLGDDRFEIVALPMKKRSIGSVRKILKNWGAENLQPYGNDPQALALVLFNEGLFTEREISFIYPTTYLVGKGGEILAVREGFLNWDTPEARALITALKNDEL